ncbi:hypothetical protein NLI96_g33 [Meripilus lineatus]|uniref:Hemolytic lectin LSLb n=1 Tax=Meripilus lineatus TaxID=2056292 RepID=A0AAD5VD95_9APHY|nr:hypothetical protein NLI96_g33 [Physisporinus lineatus]
MSKEDIYIPPEGIYFRLLGYLSQHVIVSGVGPNEVHQAPVQNEARNQYFTLIHGTGSRRGPRPNVGHVGGNGQHNNNWFEFEPGKGQYTKQFRLITPSDGVALVSRTHRAPYFWNHPRGDIYPDQHFCFLFEDMRIDRIDYDLDVGKIISSTPLLLASQTLTNNTNQEQEMSFSLNETTSHTSTFEYSTGFTLATGTEFKAGIPLFAEAKFTIDASATNQWTWGEQTSFSKSYTITFPVRAGPNETVRAISTINRGELEVPFTMHLSSRISGTKTETKGVWRGLSTWDLRHTISNE